MDEMSFVELVIWIKKNNWDEFHYFASCHCEHERWSGALELKFFRMFRAEYSSVIGTASHCCNFRFDFRYKTPNSSFRFSVEISNTESSRGIHYVWNAQWFSSSSSFTRVVFINPTSGADNERVFITNCRKVW